MRTIALLIAFAVYLAWCDQNLTKEEALDKDGKKCIRTGSYMDDCNTCRCTAGSYPGCTKIFCDHTNVADGRKAIPLITKENALDEKGLCIRSGTYPVECGNTCTCSAGNYPSCTEMACAPIGLLTSRKCGAGDSHPGNLTKESALGSDRRCRKSGSYKDDCNTCSCKVGSYPICTLMACPRQVAPEPSCIVPKCSLATACYLLYEPVCGVKIEFRNFSNLCLLEGQGCRDGFRYFKDGPCN